MRWFACALTQTSAREVADPEANGVGDIRECPGCSILTLGTDAQAVVDVKLGTDALSPPLGVPLACCLSLDPPFVPLFARALRRLPRGGGAG